MKPVTFSVIGCGNIGARHLAVVDADPGAAIAALCDVSEPKRVKWTEAYGGVPAFADYHEMLRKVQSDVVSICTPHALHAEMAIAAANAGRHVLVEKPMSLTTAEADAMAEAAERNGVRLMVVKQNRHNIPVELTRQALERGALGRIYMTQCNVAWNRHEGYYKESDWRGRKALEGGALYTQASHFIDLMTWWFGDVVEASADVQTCKHNIEIEDCGSAWLRFSTGVMGSLLWTVCVYGKNYEGSITIIGERGTIKIGGSYLNRIEYWDVESFPMPEGVQFVDKPNLYGKYQGTSSNHDKVVADVVACLRGGSHTVVEAFEGRKSIAAIERIYAGARRS